MFNFTYSTYITAGTHGRALCTVCSVDRGREHVVVSSPFPLRKPPAIFILRMGEVASGEGCCLASNGEFLF